MSFRIKLVASTESTNIDVRGAAENGEPEGLVVQALRQMAGKGRQGRRWESPEGNLYLSVLLRPKSAAQDVGLYSFVAALAVHDAVRAFLPEVSIKLKWPNDVLVNGKKICGILLEAGSDWLVVGMGLNVLQHPGNGLYPATSLVAEGGQEIAVDKVRDELLQALEAWQNTLINKGFEPVRATWLAKAQTGSMVARLPHETVQGEFKDLDQHGRLILRLADGSERAIAAGDVFFAGSGVSIQGSEISPDVGARPLTPDP